MNQGEKPQYQGEHSSPWLAIEQPPSRQEPGQSLSDHKKSDHAEQWLLESKPRSTIVWRVHVREVHEQCICQ